jgi:hypothetical protein
MASSEQLIGSSRVAAFHFLDPRVPGYQLLVVVDGWMDCWSSKTNGCSFYVTRQKSKVMGNFSSNTQTYKLITLITPRAVLVLDSRPI